ncbi:MAG: DUF4838 domain-containing protein [Clostridiales bacterium]|nr:DUF4838 domain-containing protein [Clostridiales bacterium]
MKKKNIIRVIASALCSALFISSFAACGNVGGSSEQENENNSSTQELAVVEGEYLYRNGVSGYTIVLRDEANFYEELAASELAQNLANATGSSIAVAKESTTKAKTRVISLGHTDLWDSQVGKALSSSDIIDSGYYIETVGNNVFISCPDYTSSSGVLYGVYDFLKDAIDYEFYAADEIHIEKKKNIPLYDYTGYIVNPAFQIRSLVHAEMRDDSLSNMRYRMIYPTESYGFVNWGHGQTSKYVKRTAPCTCGEPGCEGKTYYQHHPDWFSTENSQLCYTGGEVLERVTAERFIDYFKQFPDATYFMFGQEDVIGHCDCDRCKQAMVDYGANQGGLQVAFMNNVIEIANDWLEKNQPGRKVFYVVYAYYGTRMAPVVKTESGEIKPYSDRVVPHDDLLVFYTPIETNYAYQLESGINADIYNDLYGWGKIADGQILMYLYDINFHAYLINFHNFNTVQGMYEECKELGVISITSQSASTYVTGFREMRSYVESWLMWDLNLSYTDLVQKFMKAYYKDAAEYMYEFYEIMRDRYTYYHTLVNPGAGGIYGDVQTVNLWSQAVVAQMDEQFDAALASIEKYKTSDPALHEKLESRIMKERLMPLYLKLTLLTSYYSAEELAEFKATFKYYVNYFRLSDVMEGHPLGDLVK